MPSPSQSRSSAVRRLFDDGEQANLPAGHADNVANIALESKKEELNKAKERWNFDFESETPLQGRWEWTSDSSSQPSLSVRESSEADKPPAVREESESIHAPEDSTSSKEPAEASKGSETSTKPTEEPIVKVSRLSQSSPEESIDDLVSFTLGDLPEDFSIRGFLSVHAPRERSESVIPESRLSDESPSPVSDWDFEKKLEHPLVLKLPPKYLEKAKSIYKSSLKQGLKDESASLFTGDYLQSILSRLIEKSKGLEEGSIPLLVDTSEHPEYVPPSSTTTLSATTSSLSATSSKESDGKSSSREKTTRKTPVKESRRVTFPGSDTKRLKLTPEFFENLIATVQSLPEPTSPPSAKTGDSDPTDISKELAEGVLRSLLTAYLQETAHLKKKSSLTSTDRPSTSKQADLRSLASTDRPSTSKKVSLIPKLAEKSSDEARSVEEVSSASSDGLKERKRENIPEPAESLYSVIAGMDEPESSEVSSLPMESGASRGESSSETDEGFSPFERED